MSIKWVTAVGVITVTAVGTAFTKLSILGKGFGGGNHLAGAGVALPTLREAGQKLVPGSAGHSGAPAIQGCKYNLQFGGCRLLHWHTGRWHCTQSPRSQASRAQSSVQAANLQMNLAVR